MFPFAERSDGDGGRVSGGSQDRLIQCYSCGSLFNRDTPSCAEFDRQNETQRTTCKLGEVCLLYECTKNKSEKGSYRECFQENIILGHPDDPVIPQPDCRLAKTQKSRSSSIRACLCTEDYCNIEQIEPSESDNQSASFFSSTSVTCPSISVSSAEYAD